MNSEGLGKAKTFSPNISINSPYRLLVYGFNSTDEKPVRMLNRSFKKCFILVCYWDLDWQSNLLLLMRLSPLPPYSLTTLYSGGGRYFRPVLGSTTG